MAGYRVAIPLQFIRKVYIGSVNMAADFEIDSLLSRKSGQVGL